VTTAQYSVRRGRRKDQANSRIFLISSFNKHFKGVSHEMIWTTGGMDG
jgi:hypothetical protein